MIYIYKLLNNPKGSAAMLAIIGMLFLGIIGAAYATLASSNVTSSSRVRDDIAAQYLAEAGAQWAIAQLTANPNYVTAGFTSPIKNAGTATAGTYTVTITQNPDNTTAIKSIGRVNNSISRTVALQAKPGSGSSDTVKGDVFTKYTAFATKELVIDNIPTIIGDVGTNTLITPQNTGKPVRGASYAPNVLLPSAWNYSAVANGYHYANPAGTLTISIPKLPAIPDMPTKNDLIASGATNLASITGTTTLPGGTYYYDGYANLSNRIFKATTGQSIKIYIYGSMQSENLSISGENITIYASGSITLNNNTSIQTNNNGTLNIYAGNYIQLTNNPLISGTNITIQSQKNITLDSTSSINKNPLPNSTFIMYAQDTIQITNYALINSENVLIQTNGKINFNSDNTSINKDSSSAINKIYANDDIQFTNKFKLGGKAGLVVTNSSLNLNSDIKAPNAIFVGGKDSTVTNNADICGIYVIGKLTINSAPKINEVNSKSTILQSLTSGTGSSSPEIISWSNK
ncbi:DUF7305 domain-containing protein [Sporomusa malonica]|uniref:DUF7305 domain-containing protein n=1 Tax=Sporomusa malonica TaxID=112901 RepID=A0A1W2EA64_9FIRM|nr:hypothetical protein [Sporomusa malonica]SMD06437.1 hypothetical protein SAMN04488500_12274 [Sporomusa malonica]